jgi:hypothetical protein
MTTLELDVPNTDETDAPPVLSSGRRTTVLIAMCLALVMVVAGVTMLGSPGWWMPTRCRSQRC